MLNNQPVHYNFCFQPFTPFFDVLILPLASITRISNIALSVLQVLQVWGAEAASDRLMRPGLVR